MHGVAPVEEQNPILPVIRAAADHGAAVVSFLAPLRSENDKYKLWHNLCDAVLGVLVEQASEDIHVSALVPPVGHDPFTPVGPDGYEAVTLFTLAAADGVGGGRHYYAIPPAVGALAMGIMRRGNALVVPNNGVRVWLHCALMNGGDRQTAHDQATAARVGWDRDRLPLRLTPSDRTCVASAAAAFPGHRTVELDEWPHELPKNF